MNKNNTTNRIYNHNFDNNADKRNYIYDAINKTTAPKQPLVKIPTNGAIKTNFQSQIQITTPMGILNQGNLGCCGPNALAIAMCIATNNKIQDLCRLYQYPLTEILDKNNPTQDNGVTTKNLVISVQKYGCCSEAFFTYIPSNYLTFPPIMCFTNKYNVALTYSNILQDVNMITNLQNAFNNTQNGSQYTGIIVGIKVYASFETNIPTASGIIPLPNAKKEQLLGGHEICLVGYISQANLKVLYPNYQNYITSQIYIIFQNSWGSDWGYKGCGFLPREYLTNADICEKPTLISVIYKK